MKPKTKNMKAMKTPAAKENAMQSTLLSPKGMKPKTENMKAMKTPTAKVNASQSTLIRIEPAGPTTFSAMSIACKCSDAR